MGNTVNFNLPYPEKNDVANIPEDIKKLAESVEKAINEGVGRENTYSIEETFTGKYWIDGKPIYRKVIETITPADGNNSTLVTGINYIETLIKLNGFIYSTSVWGINDYLNDTYKSSCYYSVSGGEIRIAVGTSLYSKPIKLILEYTKITS